MRRAWRGRRGARCWRWAGRVLREGTAVALLCYGARLKECLKAADELAARGLSATVADARFAKPLDTDLIERLAREHEVLITIEEGTVGGFGSLVLHHLAWAGLLDRGLKIRPLVLPDRFIDHDSPARQLTAADIDAGASAGGWPRAARRRRRRRPEAAAKCAPIRCWSIAVSPKAAPGRRR